MTVVPCLGHDGAASDVVTLSLVTFALSESQSARFSALLSPSISLSLSVCVYQ
jgi:hypothetical protein